MAIWLGYHRISRVGGRPDTPVSEGEFERMVTAFAERNGFQLELLPVEKDQTGSKFERRIFKDAMRRIEDGEAAGVIVVRYNRLSRATVSDTHLAVEHIERAGGKVRSVMEDFPDTPEGRMARDMSFATSRMEWERSSSFIAQAKIGAVEAGIWPLPMVPFGYTCTRRKEGGDGKLHPDPEQRTVVLRGFEARAAGHSWRHVATVLGVGPSHAAKIIRNRVYLGELHYVGASNLEAHEPLVTRELWDAAQLEHPRPARRGNPPALLMGLVRCAGCRYVMTRDAGPKGHLYRCIPAKSTGVCQAPAIMGARKLEDHVEAIVLHHLEGGQVTAAQRHRDVDEAEQRVRDLETGYDAFLRTLDAAGMGVEHAAAVVRARAEEVEEARRDLTRKRQAIGPLPDIKDVRAWWEDLSLDERRHVLRGFLSIAWVRKGHATASQRVRLIAPGFEPAGLPRPGRRKIVEVGPIVWEANMPGELGMPATEHLG